MIILFIFLLDTNARTHTHYSHTSSFYQEIGGGEVPRENFHIKEGSERKGNKVIISFNVATNDCTVYNKEKKKCKKILCTFFQFIP